MSTQYQITCVCGHRFFVQDSGLNKPLACPQCNRALMPVVAEGEGQAVPAHPVEPTRRCPFCGETILAVARKCRFCGEFLDRKPAAGTDAKAEQEAKDKAAEPVFTLSVSQWDNIWKFIICITVVAATAFVLKVFAPDKALLGSMGVFLLMFLAMVLFYLGAKNARCIIRPARLETQTGIFSKQTDNLELWRVIDIQLQQHAFERILGIGTIYLKSSDENCPVIELYKIPKARKVFSYLQEQVPKIAKERGVVYIEKPGA